MCLLPWKLLLTTKLWIYSVLNMKITWKTIIKSPTIFNANRARNAVTIWMFGVCNVPNKKQQQKKNTHTHKKKHKKLSESSI